MPGPDPAPDEARSSGRRAFGRWLPVAVVALSAVAVPVVAGGSVGQAGPTDEVLISGAEVYQTVCQACHQPGGVGIEGDFPPLLDNPNVQDAAYVEDVIRNGRTGPLEVNGVAYDGVMPPQIGLSDDDIVAVIAYIQGGFVSPVVEGDTGGATGPVAGTELPILADYAWIAAMALAIGAAAIVLGPRVVGAHDRRTMPWLDAWLKSAVIVVGMIFGTTWLPSKVLELDAVRDLSRNAQDIIAVGLWLGALAGGIWALWYAHKEDRI